MESTKKYPFHPGKEGYEKAKKYLEEKGILEKVLQSNPPGVKIETVLFTVANTVWENEQKNVKKTN